LKLIDDAFKHTLDVLFPKPPKPEESPERPNGKNKKKVDDSDEEESDSDEEETKPVHEPRKFSVDGYTDEENMW
jgi:hypothetical protein